MVDVDEHGRTDAPLDGDEAAVLTGFLDYQRATFAWKCAGLDAESLQVKVASSSMTLGGMLKHLANVEDIWFTWFLLGEERPAPWDTVDWATDPGWDWHSAAADTPDQLRGQWEASVARSRSSLERALTDGDLSQKVKRIWPGWELPNARWALAHMIEEYSRHNGHADLIREAIDGETGE